MSAPKDLTKLTPGLADPAKLIEAWTAILTNGMEVIRARADLIGSEAKPLPFDPQAPMRAWAEFGAGLWSNPDKLFEVQQTFGSEWLELWTASANQLLGKESAPAIAPEKGDRRFNDPAWNQPFFHQLKQAYLLASRQLLHLVEASDLDAAARTRVSFYARQFLNALSPTNYIFTNPEVLSKSLESGGVNLLSGLANMLADAAQPGGLVRRRSADEFAIGENIAATPGSVVYQNELMQLIQYSPTTGRVYRRPILYVPPLVNKYYMLDLQKDSSMMRWLVEQGHTVFVISWVNPGPELRDKGLSDYIRQGPVEALGVIERATGERAVDLMGFCMGGALATIAAAYLSAAGEEDRVGSLTMIGTLLESSEMGEWATFFELSHLDAFERHVEASGVIGAEELQALFSVVRANDLIWPSVVNHYLLDREAPPSDLLFWFADGARIPQAFVLEYVFKLIRGNALTNPGELSVGGHPIALNSIRAPVCMISLKDDHVSHWEATYRGARLLGGNTMFLLGGSGHNAGVINPPSANRHGFWYNQDLPETAEQWMEGAEQRKGSWWPTWQAWLAADGKKVAARTPGTKDLPVIEPAPGSYVRMR